MKKLLALLSVAAIIVIVFIATRQPAAKTDDVVLPDLADDYAVYMRNQGMGSSMTIDTVQMAQPGFAVARATGSDSVFTGEVLGATPLLAAGKTEGAGMSLTRDTRPDERVYVILYNDTNGSGAYEDGVDEAALDAAGNRVYTITIVYAGL